jgi:hypothetical protein
MNYLQLCQRLRAECQDIGIGPTSVQSAASRDQNYIQAIREAWLEIQLSRPDWNFWPTTPTAYTVLAPQLLAVDADIPFIPEQYHPAIVYFALGQRALTASAPELVEKSNQMWSRYYSMLVNRYTGEITVGKTAVPVYNNGLFSVGEELAQ